MASLNKLLIMKILIVHITYVDYALKHLLGLLLVISNLMNIYGLFVPLWTGKSEDRR